MFLRCLSAREYAELKYFASLEPIGYARSDRDCVLTSPNGVDPELLQYKPEQTDNEIADLILSTVE